QPSDETLKQRHPDFQSRCDNAVSYGMVNGILDAQGKPVNSGTGNLAPECTLDVGPEGDDHCDAEESCPSGFDSCDQLHGNHRIAGYPDTDPFYFWYRDDDAVSKTKSVAVDLDLVGGKYEYEDNLFPWDND